MNYYATVITSCCKWQSHCFLFFFFFFKFQIILFKNPAIQLPYVAQGSYIGVPVVYITHLTRKNIKLSKKYTPFHSQMNITNIHVHLIVFFTLTLFFITNIIVANRKTNYNYLRTVSLNKTNCSYLINRTHLIVLSVVLRQQRGYLFLHTFSYFHSWDLQLSSVCFIHSNGIIASCLT